MVTLSEQIAAWLREQILAGCYEPEVDPLPSEYTLMDTFGVSRPTARRAFRILREEGLIVTRKQVGSFVAAPRKRGRGRPPPNPSLGAAVAALSGFQGHVLLLQMTSAVMVAAAAAATIAARDYRRQVFGLPPEGKVPAAVVSGRDSPPVRTSSEYALIEQEPDRVGADLGE